MLKRIVCKIRGHRYQSFPVVPEWSPYYMMASEYMRGIKFIACTRCLTFAPVQSVEFTIWKENTFNIAQRALGEKSRQLTADILSFNPRGDGE